MNNRDEGELIVRLDGSVYLRVPVNHNAENIWHPSLEDFIRGLGIGRPTIYDDQRDFDAILAYTVRAGMLDLFKIGCSECAYVYLRSLTLPPDSMFDNLYSGFPADKVRIIDIESAKEN